MRRSAPLIVGAVVVVALLTGCGDDGDGDDAAGTATCDPPDATLQVVARDSLEFDAESYEAGAGCIEVGYVNDGGVAHTLLVDDVEGFKLSVGDSDEGALSARGRHLPPVLRCTRARGRRHGG